MPAAQNVTLEPSLHRVLAEHFHNSTVRCKLPAVSILRKVLAEPHLLTNFIDRLELVGLCLVWAEDAEVLHVLPHHLPEKIAELGDATGQRRAGFLDFNSEPAETRHLLCLVFHANIFKVVGAYPPIDYT